MKRSLAGLGLFLLASQVAFSQPRVVNVTPDSEKDWLPPVELEQQARRTATDFMAEQDSGQVAKAYGRLAEIDRKDQPFAEYSDRIQKFNAQAGAVVERRITVLTWTKNPANAPLPGIYVSLDLISRFAKVERHCGYLVLYQPPSGGAFQVMREENNYMDNATADDIARKSSPAEVAKSWASLSAHCPNYRPVSAGPLAEASGPTIGYPNVAAALAGLHAKSGVVFKEQAGWTIAEDDADHAFWSFPPPGNPAYPAAVKRFFIQTAAGLSLEMAVHCEASKQACDDLVRSFQELNDRMAAGLREHK